MDLSLIIAQLRQYCPPLGGRVGGAADYDPVTEVIAFTGADGSLAYPAAVVIPLREEAIDLDELPGPQLNQQITEYVGVLVEFDATADRRGQGGVSQVEAMKYAIHAAILNWNPAPGRSTNGLRAAGGQLLKYDRARLFWQFEYSLSCLLTDADGWPLRGDPLTEIEGHVTGLDPEIVFKAAIIS